MSVIVYALVIANGILIALAIYACILTLILSPKHSQVAPQVAPANGARGAGAPSNEAARAPIFEADPHDPDMVLPAAWPAHNVTDMNGRPYFVGRS